MRKDIAEILIDWIEFTALDDCEEFDEQKKRKIETWGFDFSKFKSLDKGLLGYKKRLWSDYTQILYHGNIGMRIHFIMSGQGVRAYEQRSRADKLIQILVNEDVSFTRVDLALDVRNGSIKFTELLKYLNKNNVVTRFKKYKYIVEKEMNEDGQVVLGESVYFGSKASNIFIRIYDKAKQLEQSGEWIRIEIVYKNDHANALALYIAHQMKDKNGELKEVGQLFAETLQNYLRFVEPSKIDKNKRRWRTASFWQNVITSSERLKLSFKGVEVDPKRSEEWIRSQVAPTLAFLNQYWGGDMKKIERIITGAEDRIPEKYTKILKDKGVDTL